MQTESIKKVLLRFFYRLPVFLTHQTDFFKETERNALQSDKWTLQKINEKRICPRIPSRTVPEPVTTAVKPLCG